MNEGQNVSAMKGGGTIDDYPRGTALIQYILNGTHYQWAIGATGDETEEELKRHLERLASGAQFVSVDIKTLAGVVIKR